ncbi:lytic transglycosylase domain-containing protein [Thalassotalea mangrovi]|uniref:Lytic transglycosylase domain-containing protein n=1 Tax=Thalassotalea mangrovi TaxID=2572245 RepID=A0A4U1BAR2_9GAMM|nr:lytic transglycosylase domain-containing protein [Thalassotalea mangrovi]TKB47148.1 lytic transglycosylase domain-containing protein [Thalassotalea mangrovi]
MATWQNGLSLLIFFLSGICLANNTTIYQYTSKDGVVTFSDKQPEARPYTLYRSECYACSTNSTVNWYQTRLNTQDFQQEIISAAAKYRVDTALIRAVIHAESHFDHRALSKQGAQGLMQLMPATAESLGVSNPFVAEQNIYGGVQHLARLLKKYRGDIKLATAAYNAGEGNVRKYGGIPPFTETRNYVERVRILHQRYRNARS